MNSFDYFRQQAGPQQCVPGFARDQPNTVVKVKLIPASGHISLSFIRVEIVQLRLDYGSRRSNPNLGAWNQKQKLHNEFKGLIASVWLPFPWENAIKKFS